MADYDFDTKGSHEILDQLNSFSVPKWGFVVVRCTYCDDDAWSQFMERLDAALKDCFEDGDEIDAQVLARHDFTVQEDPTLEGASKEVIRQKFIRWLDTNGKAEYGPFPTPGEEMIKREIPRFSFCIAVDKDSMDSVLADEFKTFEGHLVLGEDAYVNVLRADDDWLSANYPDFATFDWSQYSRPDKEELDYDQREEEVEGCRLYDVGWMKFRLFDLYLDLWTQLAGAIYQWDNIYVRPSEGLAMHRNY